MPDLSGFEFWWDHWNACGATNPEGTRLSWSEAKSYGEVHSLLPEEVDLMVEMSRSYLEGKAMTNPLSKTPMEIASD